MSDDEFVTKAECYKTHVQITGDINQVKNALVGEDLRGGIVKDVADTKKDIAEIKTTLKNNPNRNNGNSLGKRERAMVYSSLIASGGVIIVEIVKTIFH